MRAPTHPTNRPNFTEVTAGDLTVWFSYQTPIAFHTPHTGTVVRVNDWNVTTGKHLNYIDPDKSARIPGHVFEAQLAEVEARISGGA